MKENHSAPGTGIVIYVNTGDAQISAGKQFKGREPVLDARFVSLPDNLPGAVRTTLPAVGITLSDLDSDQDVDLFVLADQSACEAILNDRLLRFRRQAFPSSLVPAGEWNGALVFDANRDGRSDLFIVGRKCSPIFLIGQPGLEASEVGKWFRRGTTNSPPLLHAQAIDIDLDGRTDVIGLSSEHRPVLLHNNGQGLIHVDNAFGMDSAWPKDLIAVAAGDFSGNRLPDVLVWSEGEGLQLYENKGNGNHGLKLRLTGLRMKNDQNQVSRCNADATGARVEVAAGEVWTCAECTTLSAGLAQSQQGIFVGLGRHAQADVIRIRWPDATWQAEFHQPASPEQIWYVIEEINRKTGSCPILFTWNGERFVFVTDFLGAGSVGETQPDGTHRPPRPEESVKIEPHQLAPLDGRYVLKLSEPMDEVTYLDRLQLVVVDHPADMRVYPDERFSEASPPTQDLLAFRQEIF